MVADLEDVVAITGDPTPDLASVAEFVSLRAGAEVEFVHHLVQRTAYEGLSYRARTALHGAAADRLETLGAAPAILSLHCFNGGRHEAAWRYSREAGDQARSGYAPVEAARCYERALAAVRQLASPDPVAMGDVWQALAQVSLDLGDRDRATTARPARKLATDPIRLAELELETGDQQQQAGNYPQALGWLTRGRRLIERSSDERALRLVAEIDEVRSRIRHRQGRYVETMELARQAVDEARAVGHRVVEARSLGALGTAAASAGRPWNDTPFLRDRAVHAPQRPAGSSADLQPLRRRGLLRRAMDRGCGLLGAAERHYMRAGREEDAVTDGADRAEILIDQGRYDDAAPLLERALRTWRSQRCSKLPRLRVEPHGAHPHRFGRLCRRSRRLGRGRCSHRGTRRDR